MPRGRLRSTLRSVAAVVDRGGVGGRGGRGPGPIGSPTTSAGSSLIGARTGKVSQVLGRFVAFTNVGVELRGGSGSAWRTRSSRSRSPRACSPSSASPSCRVRGDLQGLRGPLPVLTHRLILAVSHVFASGLDVSRLSPFGRGGWSSGPVLRRPERRHAAEPGGRRAGGRRGLAEHLAGRVLPPARAFLLECDVPLGEALRLTGKGVQRRVVRAGLARRWQRRRRGHARSPQALLAAAGFPGGWPGC